MLPPATVLPRRRRAEESRGSARDPRGDGYAELFVPRGHTTRPALQGGQQLWSRQRALPSSVPRGTGEPQHLRLTAPGVGSPVGICGSMGGSASGQDLTLRHLSAERAACPAITLTELAHLRLKPGGNVFKMFSC